AADHQLCAVLLRPGGAERIRLADPGRGGLGGVPLPRLDDPHAGLFDRPRPAADEVRARRRVAAAADGVRFGGRDRPSSNRRRERLSLAAVQASWGTVTTMAK